MAPAGADDVAVGSALPVDSDGDGRAGDLGDGQVGSGVPRPGRNSATVPLTSTESPTLTVGAELVKTKMPSEVASFVSGDGSW